MGRARTFGVKMEEIIRLQRNVLRVPGLWPSKNKSFFGKFRQFSMLISAATLSITMIFQTVLYVTDFEQLSKILYITTTMVSFMVKVITFHRYDRYFFEMIQQMQQFDSIAENSPDRYVGVIKKSKQLSFRLCRFYLTLVGLGGVTFGLFPIIEKNPLIFPFPYFNTGPLHYPFFIFQCVVINFSAWSNASLDLSTSGFMIVAATQLDIIKIRITHVINSVNTHNEKRIEKKLRQVCIHHLQVIKFVQNIENLFTVGTLAQFASSIVCICNTGFCFLLIPIQSVQAMNLFLYAMAMLSQLSVYCWFGNELILKSFEVCDACYNSNWYLLSPKLNKYVFLIMERTKKPLIIKAYKMANLSLATFTSIMHWSYSYYALLRRLYQSEDKI